MGESDTESTTSNTSRISHGAGESTVDLDQIFSREIDRRANWIARLQPRPRTVIHELEEERSSRRSLWLLSSIRADVRMIH